MIVGSCAAALASYNKRINQKHEHFDRLNAALKYHKISGGLGLRVRQFIESLYACGHYGEQDLYRDVPRSLQTALDLEKNKPLIVKVALFREVTPACTVALLKAMQQLHFPPREYVIVQGQIGTCMYFINRGTVQVTICKDAPEVSICQLKDGDNFGAESLMNPEWRRRANILTLTFCIFHMLDAVDFNAICYRCAHKSTDSRAI